MLATFALIAALQVTAWMAAMTSLPARQIVSDLRQIAAAHSGAVAMGYSANYRLTFFRPELVFHGQPYTLDAASMMDWHWSGQPFPAAALNALRDCAVDAWVIPAGSATVRAAKRLPDRGRRVPGQLPRDVRGALCARDVRTVVRRLALPAARSARRKHARESEVSGEDSTRRHEVERRRTKRTSWLGALGTWSHRAARGRIAGGVRDHEHVSYDVLVIPHPPAIRHAGHGRRATS